VSVPQGELAPATFAISGHIPLRKTTLPRKQVGESASPRLDAGDRMADGPKRIKVIEALTSKITGSALETIGLFAKGSPTDHPKLRRYSPSPRMKQHTASRFALPVPV
jgi:hypothetical protein